jgi:hypothetical protein
VATNQNYKFPEQVHEQLSISFSVRGQPDVLGILKVQMPPADAVNSKLDDVEREFAQEAATPRRLMLTGSYYALWVSQVLSE